MSFFISPQALVVAASSAGAALEATGAAEAAALDVAGAAEVVEPSAPGCGSQPDIAITAATAEPVRTSRVQYIDVSPMIIMSGRDATNRRQTGRINGSGACRPGNAWRAASAAGNMPRRDDT
ncbi:hypothetical protein [Actinoplanes sp. NPDC051411]|uniref:hypothetical protein n=1 Tax=Actinoplanes sp. NPDC051411 TaxID=3155522 RepID=UPI003420D70C